MDEVTLPLEPPELMALIEALRDALIRRVRWTVLPSGERWQQLEFPTAQTVIDNLASAYGKAWMLLDSYESRLDPEFRKLFRLPPEFWDITNRITLSDDWASAPTHEPHNAATNCVICVTFSEA